MTAQIEGTPTTLAASPSATSHTFTYPAGVTLGEVIFLIGAATEDGDSFTSSGWTFVSADGQGQGSMTTLFGWRIATGSESGNFIVSIVAGTAAMSGTVVRLSGVDTTDPTNSSNVVSSSVGSSQTNFTIAANTLTGLATGSGVLVYFGVEGTGITTTADADLVEIALINVNPGVNAYIDLDAGGSGNAQYDMITTPARNYSIYLIEVKAAAVSADVVIFRRRIEGN